MQRFLLIISSLYLVLASNLVCAEVIEQTKTGSDPLAFSSLVQLTLGMLTVLAIIIGLAWILKRSGRFQITAGGGLKILGGLSMGARERVVLLQVGETQLLVGVSPGSVKTLHVLDKPLVQGNETNTIGSGFAQQLSSMLSGGKTS
ncbi:MAG: flagellar biosynthetic protein FliO [Gammaproteobacteria bacterium]